MRKIYFMFSIIFLIFFFNSVSVEAFNDVSCEYSMKEGEAFCYQQFEETYINNSTFTAVIYFSKQGEQYIIESDYLPKVIVGREQFGYINNLQANDNPLYPKLKNVDTVVSAADYYNMQGCPPYFAIDFVLSAGIFVSEYKTIEDIGYANCIFPNVKKEYNENLESKDEQYSCSLYSSDPYYSEFQINVNINYTKKSINYGNETSDGREVALNATQKYKDNFNYDKKNECPINQLKICSMGNLIYVYPKDFEDTIVKDCAELDSSKQLEVGDNYCNFVVDSSKELKNFEKKNQDFYSKLFVLKNFCNLVLKNNDYNSDKFSCINMCLNINDHIPNDTFLQSKCGLASKLILFIANIVKWLKYIIPVIVIVLGILDFIKAIATEKEDEIKKAQKSFVTRLIAAALIFITPFIIEFVLEKMGFISNGCGIIDL